MVTVAGIPIHVRDRDRSRDDSRESGKLVVRGLARYKTHRRSGDTLAAAAIRPCAVRALP